MIRKNGVGVTVRDTTRWALAVLLACGAVAGLHVAGRPRAEGQGLRRARVPEAGVRAEMLVSTDWLGARLNDPRVAVLHVARERAHYEQGHVPGAHFVALGEIASSRGGVPNELPPAAELRKLFERLGVGDAGRVVLYGDNAGLSAARAYFTLDYLGHGARASLLDGGLEKWQAERRRVSTASAETKSRPFTPRVRAEAVTDRDVVRDLSWVAANVPSSATVLIDARPAEEYTGAKPGEGVPRGGHIPGAANVFWMQHLVSRESPVMRPAAELRRLYEAAGARRGVKVVTYCRTGVQASHAYFTAKYLGYDVVMYDGSFI
ncbi:MAG TPA: sulfurtransferase, partial [Pyrinomonadaceae bacterium]